MALQVARKIAPCDRALIHVCLAYLFLHSRQVLSSFKCYFKRKYLNLIDSNCDVDESCPWFFIGTVLAAGPECIINIYVILGGEISLRWAQFDLLAISGEASRTFDHANANLYVFIDRIRN